MGVGVLTSATLAGEAPLVRARRALQAVAGAAVADVAAASLLGVWDGLLAIAAARRAE